MLKGLAHVRRRVEQMARQTASAVCAGNHQRTRIIWVQGDDPPPPWPEADAGGRCVCGAKLQYVSLVNAIRREQSIAN